MADEEVDGNIYIYIYLKGQRWMIGMDSPIQTHSLSNPCTPPTPHTHTHTHTSPTLHPCGHKCCPDADMFQVISSDGISWEELACAKRKVHSFKSSVFPICCHMLQISHVFTKVRDWARSPRLGGRACARGFQSKKKSKKQVSLIVKPKPSSDHNY